MGPSKASPRTSFSWRRWSWTATARSLLESVGLDFAALKEHINPTAPPLRLEASLDLAPVTETIDTARILDASANRAREALRVLEDFVRFVRADAFLSAEIKTLRHRLADALRQLPEQLLLQARDTPHDVGTAITTDQEQERASPRPSSRRIANGSKKPCEA